MKVRAMEELALHVLDIARNSVEAGARCVEIEVVEDPDADILRIEVRDDGRGMPPGAAARAADPSRTARAARRGGMGLPLLREACRAAGGELAIESDAGRGTRVRASFRHGHIDRAPLGDIGTTVFVLAAANGDLRIRFRHERSGRSWEIDSLDFEAGDIGPLREAIRRGEESLAGLLPEGGRDLARLHGR